MISKIKKILNLSLSRKIQILSNLYHRKKTQYFYKFMFKNIGEKSIIKSPMFITPEFISVGDNVIFWNDARIEGVSHYANDKFNPHIIIEDGVSFQQRCHITAADTLIIGKNSMILFDVMITDMDHEYKDLSLPIVQQPLIVKATTIGESCFIGSGAKIQAGSILGRHCVVGANSVVRGVFPDYCVIVGAPARVVKRYDKASKIWRKVDDFGMFF
jgi:acetyltransferase-like isoleucine patch superfamily enzyme